MGDPGKDAKIGSERIISEGLAQAMLLRDNVRRVPELCLCPLATLSIFERLHIVTTF